MQLIAYISSLHTYRREEGGAGQEGGGGGGDGRRNRNTSLGNYVGRPETDGQRRDGDRKPARRSVFGGPAPSNLGLLN